MTSSSVHTIKQGDAFELMKELPDESVDAVIADPPYNTGMTRKAKDSKGKTGGWLQFFFPDKYVETDYDRLVLSTLLQINRVLKPDSGAFIFMGWKSLPDWQIAVRRSPLELKNIIVWDKIVHGLNYQSYAYTHEFILFATKGHFFPNNKSRGGKFYQDVWHLQREIRGKSEPEHHETVKPLPLMELAVEHLTSPDETILDPFMGSGTTGVAALRLGRSFIGYELDPEYFEIAKKRIESEASQTNLLEATL